MILFVPTCEECARRWLPADTDRWRAEFIGDGLDDALHFWCSECWEREFAPGV
jgi:hypothetical protein